MTLPSPSGAGPGRTGAAATVTYEIRVAGHLDDHWSAGTMAPPA